MWFEHKTSSRIRLSTLAPTSTQRKKKKTLIRRDNVQATNALIRKVCSESPFITAGVVGFADENLVGPFGLDDENQSQQHISPLTESLVLNAAKGKGRFQMTKRNEHEVNDLRDQVCSFTKRL